MNRLDVEFRCKKILFFFLIGGEKRDRARKEGGCEAKFEKGMVGGNCALNTRGRRPNMA